MRVLIAILLGKLIAKIIRFLKVGGGSAAPGLYALKIDPDLIRKLTKRIPKNVVITGTNGKTTTARFLAHFAKESGLKVIRNHTGSNLERGIASTLISSISWGSSLLNPRGWIASNLGIWELDEAAFNAVVPKIKPDIIIFLNVFRDQLDRYGEVDTVVKNWCNTLKDLEENTLVLVNNDDANTNKLTSCFRGGVFRFGVKDYKIIGEGIEYKKERDSLDFEAKNVRLDGLRGSKFEIILHNKSYTTRLPLPGVYHIYDFLAAFAAGTKLEFDSQEMISSLKDFSPAFGRVERFEWGYIFLIKNPAGATQVFETVAPNIKKDDRLLLALNDNIADGTDVSWIWDAEWERLQVTGDRLQVICSGTRAYDLANRLKYAEFSLDTLDVESDLRKALEKARKGLKGRLFILPTYTAMLELQRILAKMGLKKHYWEEE